MFKPTVSPPTAVPAAKSATLPTKAAPTGFPSGMVPTSLPLLKVSSPPHALSAAHATSSVANKTVFFMGVVLVFRLLVVEIGNGSHFAPAVEGFQSSARIICRPRHQQRRQ